MPLGNLKTIPRGPLDAFKGQAGTPSYPQTSPAVVEQYKQDKAQNWQWGNGQTDLENERRAATIATAENDPNALAMRAEWQRKKKAEDQLRMEEEARNKGRIAAAQKAGEEDALEMFRNQI